MSHVCDKEADIAVLKANTHYIKEKLDGFINSADDRYAPKWITNVLGWATGIISAVFITIIISFIL